MLHIILLIFKILLIVILALFGLAFLLVLLVLFLPVSYVVDGNFDKDNIKVAAKIRFLIMTFRANYDRNSEAIDVSGRILGIKFYPRNHKKSKTKKGKDRDGVIPVDEVLEDIKDLDADLVKDSEEAYDNLDSIPLEDDDKIKSNDILESNDRYKNEDTTEQSDETFLIDDEDTAIKKTFAERKSDISKKIDGFKRKYRHLKQFWERESTVRARRYLKKYMIGLIKHIAPRRAKGYVRFGFEDPATTGMVTGYLSLLPFVYQKDFSVNPDFTEKVLEGHAVIKGRIVIGYIIRVILNRDVRRTIKLVRKI